MGIAVALGRSVSTYAEIAYTNAYDDLNIYVGDVSRNLYHPITHHRYIDSSPSWSPDGKQMAYVSAVNGMAQLFTMKIFEGNPQRQASEFDAFMSPSWSPDGHEILFSILGPAEKKMALLNLDSGNLSLGPPLFSTDPIWIPNSKNVVVIGADEQGVLNLFGVNLNCLTQAETCALKKVDLLSGQFYGIPAWSPDGQAIAFNQLTNGRQRIMLARLRCQDLTEACVKGYEVIGDTQTNGTNPIWSPDSQKVAYAADGKFHIVNISTSERHTAHAAGDVSQLSWSPDGKFIAYSILSADYYTYDIYLLDVDMGESRFLAAQWHHENFLVWRPIAH